MACTPHRSEFPDLVFPDICAFRAGRISALYAGGRMTETRLDLDRATVFVTHRCNLRCVYCNGPHLNTALPEEARREMLQADLPYPLFVNLVKEWRAHGLRYLHLTGGEPTLHRDLPAMVKTAVEKGLLLSLTTNGLAEPAFYRELVQNGLYEFRISIDSGDERKFDALVGLKGAYRRVLASLEELVRLRDKQKKRLFLVLNATIGRENHHELEATLSALVALRPDDIKLLLVAQEWDEVQERPSRERIDRILVDLRQRGLHFNLLDDKVRHLYRRNVSGLTDRYSRNVIRRCYIPLTERTIDARGIYPCSVYLRYNGPSLAPADEAFPAQQRKILDFVSEHRCMEDEICRRFCLRCTRDFNLQVNRMLRDETASRGLVRMEVEAPTGEAVAAAQEVLDCILAGEAGPPRQFILLKPDGLKHSEEILSYLAEQGLKPLETLLIEDWPGCSLFLYVPAEDLPRMTEGRLLRNAAFRRWDEGRAMAVLLDPAVPWRKIDRIKREIRAWYGEERLLAVLPDGRSLELRKTPVHVPDRDRLDYELRVVRYFTKKRD